METEFLNFWYLPSVKPTAKCLSPINLDPIMEWQPIAMVGLSAAHVTSVSSPADALCDQELHVI